MVKWGATKLISIGIIGLVLLISLGGGLTAAENAVYDSMFELRGELPPDPGIIIVAMDEKSFNRMGPLPWPRDIHAVLLEQMPEAAAVGFDLLFDMEKPEEDKVFAEAISRHKHVVLASMFAFEQDAAGDWLQTLLMPNETLGLASAGIGFVNMPAEKGNIVRRISLVDTNTFDAPFPSLSLAVVLAAKGVAFEQLSLKDSILRSEKIGDIPLDELNQAMIDFAGPGGTYTTVSYSDVIDGSYPPEFFKNKLVLVGLATPTEKNDYYENPFTKGNLVLAGSLPSPGVEIHANALESILYQDFRLEAPLPVNIALLLVVGLLAVVFARPARPWLSLGLSGVLVVSFFALAFFMWLYVHLWVWVAAPVVLVAAIYLFNAVADFVRTEMERRRTRALFSRYVSGQVVDTLLANPDEAGLGGIRRDVTVLFSDVRGFTSYSDHHSPEEVVSLLNQHFSEMTQVIFQHGGMLDKYIGDAVMAVFGAPLPTEDHPQQAIKAGLAMLEANCRLCDRWREAGLGELKIGVGINTGPAIVGNIGSPERMDYTVIGGAVNLASRLESMSKTLGSPIVVGEDTAAAVGADFLTENGLSFLENCEVRGIAKPVAVYGRRNPVKE